MSTMEEHNKSTGFHKAIKYIGDSVFAVNIFLTLVGSLFFILQKLGVEIPLPEWISGYNYGILVAANSLLLLILNNAHDRYYAIYINSSELSFVGNLLDLIIKIVIFTATILQTVFVSTVIPFATLAYILTFFRNIELITTLPNDNPLNIRIRQDWLPYNIRHNVVMITFCAFFYLIKFKLLYMCISWLCCEPIEASIWESDAFISIHNIIICSFVLFFDIYWVCRALRKVKIFKDNIFKKKKLEEIEKELEEYCESSD